MKKTPFRVTPYQVQVLLIVGFVTVGYALYLRYFAVEFSTTALACDAPPARCALAQPGGRGRGCTGDG